MILEDRMSDDRPEAVALLAAVKAALPLLESLLEKAMSEWRGEDAVYRFYHTSFKCYGLQSETEKMVVALRSLAPDRELNLMFAKIVADGTGKTFKMEDNTRWIEAVGPILTAFFHARHFVEMAVRYGKLYGDLAAPPLPLDSGWATVLYLYDMR